MALISPTLNVNRLAYGMTGNSYYPAVPPLRLYLKCYYPSRPINPAMLSFQYDSLHVEPSHLRRFILEEVTSGWQPLSSDQTSSIPASTRFEIVLPSTVPSQGDHQVVPVYRYDLDGDGHETKATYSTMPNPSIYIMQGYTASTVPEFAIVQAYGTGEMCQQSTTGCSQAHMWDSSPSAD